MEIHRLLQRQLKKYSPESDPQAMRTFIEAVNQAYQESDEDRRMMERSIDLSSKELFQVNTDMRILLEAFPDLFFRVDDHGVILDYRMGTASNQLPSDLKLHGKKIQDILDASFTREFDRVMGEMHIFQTLVSFEFLKDSADGRHYFEARFVPLKEKESVIVIRNIDERKRYEGEILAQKELLMNVFEVIPHYVFWKDRHLVYLGCSDNFARAAGLNSSQEIVGKTDYDLAWRKEEADAFSKADREVMDKGESIFNVEEPQLRADGKQATMLISKVPLRDLSGRVVGMLGIFVDITDRKAIEARLLQSQKLETVGTLAGGIAHDLNNQLTPLMGFVNLLLAQAKPGEEAHEMLQEADQAAKRCADVVKRLLSFSRPSTQKRSPISFTTTLSDLNKLFSKFLPATIETHIEFPKDLWKVYGNETELQSVFMNLAANARDAMKEKGGRLDVKAENLTLDTLTTKRGFTPGKYVVVLIKDTGEGIPQKTITRIFEPFFTTKKQGEGTGLGLSMVFNTIKDHQGWIEVTSEVGRGTAFEVYLPAYFGAAEEFQGETHVLPQGTETILLADDEEPIRNLGKRMLERLGYHVLVAKDGLEAIEIYEKNRKNVDAVILDMTMPRLTGRETLQRLFQMDPKVKIILSSGYTAEGSPKELVGLGAKDFVQKPYTAVVLAQVLRKCLDMNKTGGQ